MWVCKFEFDGSNILYGKAAKLFNISLSGYNLSSFEKGKKLFVNTAGRFFGEEDKKNKFLSFLKKDKHVKNLEERNGFFMILVQEDYSFKPFYSSSFIYISPVLIDNNGKYHFHIGSWERKDIEELLKLGEKLPQYKLITLKQEKIDDVSVTKLRSDLTEKQKNTMELAVKNGYYEFPKRITLKELAKIAGISYSTFQQHLSYAEKKINSSFCPQ